MTLDREQFPALASPSQAVEVRSRDSFATAVVTWQRGSGEYIATIIAKATYALDPEVAVLLEEPDGIHEVDDHWDDDLRKSVRVPSDLAPLKNSYDIVVVGHAHAPKAAESTVIRVAVGSVDKCVEARVPSRFTPDGQLDAAAPTLRMPLRYEVGPLGPDNPVGIDPTLYDEASGRYRVPQLLPPHLPVKPGVSVPFTGVGPIAPSWSSRASLLRAQDRAWLSAMLDRPMPTGFDVSYFSIAPTDQRAADPFRADERIILECLHPQHPRLVANLAGVRPVLSCNLGGKLPELIGDTLLIDSDRGVVTLTFRAQIEIDPSRQARFEVHADTGPRARSIVPKAAAQPRTGLDESTMKLDGRTLDAVRNAGDTTSEDGVPEAGSPLPFPSSTRRARLPSQAFDGLPFRNNGDGPPSSNPGSVRPALNPLSVRRTSMPAVTGSEVQPRSVPPPPASVSARAPLPIAPPASPSSPGALLRTIAETVMESAPPSLATPLVAPPRVSSLRAPSSPPLQFATAYVPPPAAVLPIGGMGGQTVGERSTQQAVLPAIVNDELRVRANTKTSAKSDDPFNAAFPSSGKATTFASAKLASDDAAGRRDLKPAERGQPSRADAATRRFLVDLLSFHPEVPRRIRRSKSFVPLLADFSPPRALRRLDEADTERDKDRDERMRLEVLRVLSCGDPLDATGLANSVDLLLDDPNDLEIPLLLTSGELKPSFDEVEALRAAVKIAQPLSTTDKRLVSAVAVANEVLGTSPSTDTALSLLKQLDGAVSALNLPARYLTDSVERALLDTRSYKKRIVLGEPRIRCDLTVAGGTALPCYVPESVGPMLPLLNSFSVVALVEVRPREDAFESHHEALVVAALGRLLKRARR